MYVERYNIEFNTSFPFNFELTVHKPAGWWLSTPKEVFEDGVLWTAARFNHELLGLKLCSKGTFREQRVKLHVFATEQLSNKEKLYVASAVKEALRVDDDLSEFYTIAQKDKMLSDVVKDLYGMRTVAWP